MASVLAQTDRDFELLIVDDESTDGSAEVARAFTDARVRVIVRPHSGIGATRNAGLEAAEGRYIAFLDADDVWTPDKLALQCELLDRCPDVGVVYTRCGVIDDAGGVQSRGRSFLAAKPSGAIVERLLNSNVVGTPSTVCFRRALFEEERVSFDETHDHVEDWHFYLQIATRTRIQYLSRTLAYHRQHSRNMSGDVSAVMTRNLRTGQFALDLARKHLEFDEREIRRVERRMRAHAEALAAREYVKGGKMPQVRNHAARSLIHYPWNPRETTLYLLALIGWVPQVIRQRLK